MDIFFYGLFMDTSILIKNGLKPTNPRKGYLEDYELKIGTRASLLPCKGAKSYGILMTVDDDEVQKLYAEPSVADYIPEEVTIITFTNERVVAICYNLPIKSLTGTNVTYAESLYQLAKKERFPDDYLNHIRKMAEGS